MAKERLVLGPEESTLIGQWVVDGGSIRKDAVAERIEALVRGHLIEVATTDAGSWEVLYRNPADDRLWELTYPQGEMHGGGPPALTLVSADNAARKYGYMLPSNNSLQADRER